MTKCVFAFLCMALIFIGLVGRVDAQDGRCSAPGEFKIINDLTASNVKGGVHAIFTIYTKAGLFTEGVSQGFELAPGGWKCLKVGTATLDYVKVWVDKSWTKAKGTVDSFTTKVYWDNFYKMNSKVNQPIPRCIRLFGDGSNLYKAKAYLPALDDTANDHIMAAMIQVIEQCDNYKRRS